MNLYKSTGELDYYDEDGLYRLVLLVDRSICEYYYSLIPKYKNAIKQRWNPHVTIVRPKKEIPLNLEYWKKYQDESVEFYYGSDIHCGKIYYWLNVFCNRLENIREELGLPVKSEYTTPPEGFRKCFHMTLANVK